MCIRRRDDWPTSVYFGMWSFGREFGRSAMELNGVSGVSGVFVEFWKQESGQGKRKEACGRQEAWGGA